MGKLDFEKAALFTMPINTDVSNVVLRAALAGVGRLLICGPASLSQTIVLQVAWEEKASYADADFVTFQTPSGTNFEIAAAAGVLLVKPPAAAFRLHTTSGNELAERVFNARGLQYDPWMR